MANALPEGWILRVSRSKGKVFYYNTKTQQTQWTRPSGVPASSAVMDTEEPPALKRKRDGDSLDGGADPSDARQAAIVRCIRVGASSVKSEKPFQPWPHQVDAVAKTLAALERPADGERANRFLFQHSTGSGKTITIAALAHQLLYHRDHHERQFHTIVLLIDRVKLDEQVGDSVERFLRRNGVEDVFRASSIEHLASLLKPAESLQCSSPQRVIITTIQKLGLLAKNEVLLARLLHGSSDEAASKFSRIAIITDEAHRSYTSSTRQTIETITKQEEELTAAQETSSIIFLGFTATPNPEALELFGTRTKEGQLAPFHCYSMAQAVAEHRIVDVLQSYHSVRCEIDISVPSDTKATLAQHRQMRRVLDAASTDTDVLKAKASYIASHFQKRKTDWRRSKCMIVARSRQDVVRYYQLMTNFVHNKQVPWQVFAVFSGTVTIETGDPHTTVQSVTEQSLNAKNATLASSDVVIVCDKLDTGYSDPLLACMYVDRYLRSSVQTVQLFSRLNRQHSDKLAVSIVDFANHAAQIRRHFATFWRETRSCEDGTGPLTPIVELRTAVAVICDEFTPWQDARHLTKRVKAAANTLDRDAFQQVLDAVQYGLKAWGRLDESDAISGFVDEVLISRAILASVKEVLEDALAAEDDASLDTEDIIKRMKTRVTRFELLYDGAIDPASLNTKTDSDQPTSTEKHSDLLMAFECALQTRKSQHAGATAVDASSPSRLHRHIADLLSRANTS